MKPGGHGWIYIYGKGGIFWDGRVRMREIMANIQKPFAQKVISLLEPTPKFLALDGWYVPIDGQTSQQEIEDFLRDVGYSDFWRAAEGVPGDVLPRHLESEAGRFLWGSGDLRYIVRK